MKARVSYFEIPAEKVDRARKFYSEAFGWQITPVPEMEYNMVGTVPSDEMGRPNEPGAINGGMMKRSKDMKHPIISIEVDDIDESLKKVSNLGGRVAVKKTSMGEHVFAYFEDPEGNLMGLFESKRR
jgi:hypothetical protein